VLHSHTVLRPDELGLAEELALPSRRQEDKDVWPQPCPWLRPQNVCAIYGRRPQTCRSYRCRLLRAHLAGELTADAARATAAEAQELLARVAAHLPSPPTDRPIWWAVEAWVASEETSEDTDFGPLLADLAALAAALRQHFHVDD
jgi:hypothetical protein